METTLQNVRQCHDGRVVEAELVTVITPARGNPARIATPVYFWLGRLRRVFMSARVMPGQSAGAAGRTAVEDQIHELLAIAAANHLPRIGVRELEVPSRAELVATAWAPRMIESMELNGAMNRVTL